MYTISTATNNKQKIEAIREVVGKFWSKIEIQEFKDISSGVSEYPFNDEVIQGAKNRIDGLLNVTKSTMHVALESGIEKSGGEYFCLTWCVISYGGEMYYGCSSKLHIPNKFYEYMEKNGFMGFKEYLDEINLDIFDYCSNRAISRKTSFKEALKAALSSMGTINF